ncbi:MAG TPA: hypothetical protein VE089_02675 [Nitrososphaeraceae archaeon]|nr:hypothetical protein [Nitrososphaeraceae archaeon]
MMINRMPVFRLEHHRKKYNNLCIYDYQIMSNDSRRSIPICLIPKQLEQIERYAKRHGMLNLSQAIEELAISEN